METNEVTNKPILLKDINGNLLYPKVLSNSIPDGSVTQAQLSENIRDFFLNVATSLTEEVTRAMAAEQANTEKITQNTENITELQNNVLLYEVVS